MDRFQQKKILSAGNFFLWNNCFIIINFVMIIRCKINFDIIWYSVIFAANLYLSIYVWSSDMLNFVFMNVVILVLHGILKNITYLFLWNTLLEICFCIASLWEAVFCLVHSVMSIYLNNKSNALNNTLLYTLSYNWIPTITIKYLIPY